MYDRVRRNGQVGVGAARRDVKTCTTSGIESNRYPFKKRFRIRPQVDDDIVDATTEARYGLAFGMRGELVMKATQRVQMRVFRNVALCDLRRNPMSGKLFLAEMPAKYAAFVADKLSVDQPRTRNIKFLELQG